jgi:alkaline phosphatase D
LSNIAATSILRKFTPSSAVSVAAVTLCRALLRSGEGRVPRFRRIWEFVAGPLNAGTFSANALDGTFGPQVVFQKAPPPSGSNLSPLSGFQFFGEVNIAAQNGEMTVDLRDINGVSVFSRTLQPQMA